MAFDHRVVFSQNNVELPGANLTIATSMLALIIVLAASPAKAAAGDYITGFDHGASASGHEAHEAGREEAFLTLSA